MTKRFKDVEIKKSEALKNFRKLNEQLAYSF